MSDVPPTVSGMATRRPPGMPSDSELWTAPDGGRWLLTVTAWAVVDGRMEPAGVELRSVRHSPAPGGPDRDAWARGILPPSSWHDTDHIGGREPLPVTATAWRAPSLAELLASIRKRLAEDRADAVGEGAPGLRTWRATKRRRGAVTQADVVEVYLEAWAAGLPPSKTVATELHLSRDAAYQRVRRARAEGLLPKTKPGHASGSTGRTTSNSRGWAGSTGSTTRGSTRP